MNRTALRLWAPVVAAVVVAGLASTYAIAEPPGGGACTVNANGVNMRKLPNNDPPGVRGQEIHRRLYAGDKVTGEERVNGWMRANRGWVHGEPPNTFVKGWIKEEFLDCRPLPPPGEPTGW
jgi:hypothetical protein